MEKMLKLVHEAIFSDLNRAKGLDSEYATKELPLNQLKYKHLKAVQALPPERHMGYFMMVITGLTEHDLDELSSDDTAELISIVHELIGKHFELGKNLMKIVGSPEDKIHFLKNLTNA